MPTGPWREQTGKARARREELPLKETSGDLPKGSTSEGLLPQEIGRPMTGQSLHGHLDGGVAGQGDGRDRRASLGQGVQDAEPTPIPVIPEVEGDVHHGQRVGTLL